MTSYADNLEDLAHWIARQLEWSGGQFVGDELTVSPLGDDIEGSPAGFLIPRQTLLFGDGLYALELFVVVGADLAYRSYSYQFMYAESGELIWRFDKHVIGDDGPEPHLHLQPDPDRHLATREVEIDEVMDWIHRYLNDQETPSAG